MLRKHSEAIRVGFVMHKMQVAGAEVLVRQIIERLTDRIDATVICLDGLGQIGQELLDGGTPVVVLGRKPGLDWSVARRLADEVRSRRIDVLHAHQYTPFFYSALARMKHRANCRIIFTEHGRHYPDVVSVKRHWTNRLLLQRYADTTTACCDFSTKAVQEIEGFPAAITLRNGVDLSGLPPRGDAETQSQLRQSLGLDIDRPYVACVGRFHPVKDHATLIRAWARVHERLPQAQLLLVGDGEERQNIEQLIQKIDRDGVQALAAKSRLSTMAKDSSTADATRHSPLATRFSKSVVFLGIRSDVADILRAVDVFALTSISEAASLTLLEAMASECASVMTDVGGNAEHLRDGVDGYLAPRGDDEKIAAAIIDLLTDKEKCRRFGRSARERIESQFDLDSVIDQYGQRYAKLVPDFNSCNDTI